MTLRTFASPSRKDEEKEKVKKLELQLQDLLCYTQREIASFTCFGKWIR